MLHHGNYIDKSIIRDGIFSGDRVKCLENPEGREARGQIFSVFFFLKLHISLNLYNC